MYFSLQGCEGFSKRCPSTSKGWGEGNEVERTVLLFLEGAGQYGTPKTWMCELSLETCSALLKKDKKKKMVETRSKGKLPNDEWRKYIRTYIPGIQ